MAVKNLEGIGSPANLHTQRMEHNVPAKIFDITVTKPPTGATSKCRCECQPRRHHGVRIFAGWYGGIYGGGSVTRLFLYRNTPTPGGRRGRYILGDMEPIHIRRAPHARRIEWQILKQDASEIK